MQTKGSYLLFIRHSRDEMIEVGSLGKLSFPKGQYLYVGSALGAGGLKQRLLRHLKKEKKVFWHIDYLLTLESFIPEAIFLILSEQRLECSICRILSQVFDNNRHLTVYRHFGSSDCRCQGHFFLINNLLPPQNIEATLEEEFSTQFQTLSLRAAEISKSKNLFS